MTAAERLRAEEEKILDETGFYIPPFRLANLTKAAGKITDILIKADINICYEECKIILKIVAATIAAVTEEEN